MIHPIDSRIPPGILNGLGHDLHPIDLLCFLGQEQGNGPDAAVQIPHRLISAKICILQGGFVQLLRLHGIYLVK